MSAISGTKKRTCIFLKTSNRAIQRTCFERNSINVDHFCANPVTKDLNFLTEIVFDDARGPNANADTAILEKALKKYCRVFQSLFEELLNYQGHGGCELEEKIELALTDPS